MKHSKKDCVKKEEDLKFAPLNIKEPFKINTPSPSALGETEEITICTNSNFVFMGFPPLTLCTPNQLPDVDIPLVKSPIMKYPSNIPSLEPSDLTSQNKEKNTSEKITNIVDTQLEYPSEVNAEELYSYNKTRVDENYYDNLINPIDILRNFDLTIDEYTDKKDRNNYSSEDIEAIFEKIQDNNTSILGTMRAYRIPYPIAKMLIKKIIKLTLDYSKR